MNSLLEAIQEARRHGHDIHNPYTEDDLLKAFRELRKLGIRHNLEYMADRVLTEEARV